MIDLVGRVSRSFEQNIDATRLAMEMLAEPIAQASQMMTQSLLAGGKIISCGNAGAGMIARYLATVMLAQLQLPRPGLPAICLSADAGTLATIAANAGADQVFAGQLGALGEQNDILFTISNPGGDASLGAAVRIARDRDMRVILLTGDSGDALSEALAPDDVEIGMPVEDSLRRHELQLLTVHCICDLVDHQLLGH